MEAIVKLWEKSGRRRSKTSILNICVQLVSTAIYWVIDFARWLQWLDKRKRLKYKICTQCPHIKHIYINITYHKYRYIIQHINKYAHIPGRPEDNPSRRLLIKMDSLVLFIFISIYSLILLQLIRMVSLVLYNAC